MEMDEILSEEELIEKCHENNLEAFEALGDFNSKTKTDIILSDCELDTLIKFCLCNGIKSVFYLYEYPEIESYVIDKEALKRNLIKHYMNNRDVSMLTRYYENLKPDYYNDILYKVLRKMETIADKQNVLIKNIDESIPEYFEVYACYNGKNVGFFILNPLIPTEDGEDEPDIYIMRTLYENLSKELDEQILLQSEKAKEDNDRLEEKRKAAYQGILSEIAASLKTDERLPNMRFKNARQTYAEQIRKEMEAKYKISIRKGDIQEIVENTYLDLKY